jgi:hypothetical protein
LATLFAFLPIATIFVAFKIKKSRKGVGLLCWVGYYTIDIYIIHVAGSLFLVSFLAKIVEPTGILETILVVLGSAAIGILAPLVISFGILRQNRALKLLFLGKSDKRVDPEVVLMAEGGL